MSNDIENEARRIVNNMHRMATCHGTTTPEVVDEICKNYSTFLICYGQGRNMVFKPITKNTMAYKTERAL